LSLAIQNAINNKISGASAGASNTLTVKNTSNTASSSAKIQLITDLTGTPSVCVTYTNNNDSKFWSMGLCTTESSFDISPISIITSSSSLLFSNVFGNLTLTNSLQTYMSAYTSGMTISPDTLTTIIFENITYDSQSLYDGGTGVFTNNVAGLFNISASIIYQSDIGDLPTSVEGFIVVNGSAVQSYKILPNATGNYSMQLCLNTRLTSSDTVEIKVIKNGGVSDSSVVSFSDFNLMKVG